MKQLVLFAALILGLASCGNKNSQQTEANATTKAVTENLMSYELNDLLKDADNQLDQTVKVKGYVTHTCKHAGKRCFIVGEDQKTSFRVEAGGEIGGFNRELIGSKLEIKGVLKERRLSEEYIAQYEKDVNEKKIKEDGSAETCEAELKNIADMREWMKANDKNYYSIYYMNGEDYDVID
jgi:hypothetical protein